MAQRERRMSELEREEKRRQNVVDEVISLQRALEGACPCCTLGKTIALPLMILACFAEINSKVASTRAENNGLIQENENLSAYIDSLMTSISGSSRLFTTHRSPFTTHHLPPTQEWVRSSRPIRAVLASGVVCSMLVASEPSASTSTWESSSAASLSPV